MADKSKTQPAPKVAEPKKYLDPDSDPIPTGQWGVAIWNTESNSQEYPAFLDNHNDWWWATTTNQNGINPTVEKTERPVGWRAL